MMQSKELKCSAFLGCTKKIAEQLGYTLQVCPEYTDGRRFILTLNLKMGNLAIPMWGNKLRGQQFGRKKGKKFKKPLGIGIIFEAPSVEENHSQSERILPGASPAARQNSAASHPPIQKHSLLQITENMDESGSSASSRISQD